MIRHVFFALSLICVFGCKKDKDQDNPKPEMPGGLGAPEIELTHIPPQWNSDKLRGRAYHVWPDEYRICVYIHVKGWWIKPYFQYPKTAIAQDGSWSCEIFTGGYDYMSDLVAAFLIKKDYDPPLLGGDKNFPPELEKNAAAKIIAIRGPDQFPPENPSHVTAEIKNGDSVIVIWQDNSDNENGFKVYRVIENSPEEVAILPPNSTSYEDANLLVTGTICYMVSAFNAIGLSGFTEQVCVDLPRRRP